MTANVSFNPIVTTNAAGTFNLSSSGYISGTALNDPAVRNLLAGGIVASTETVPMWGGIGISEVSVPVASSGNYPSSSLGGYITRATNISTVGAASSLTGFTVFDQGHAMINTPQSPVPVAGSYQTIGFYRLGSNARIVVPCDPALISLNGTIVTNRVSWDFVNQRLEPYIASALTISSATYVSGTGVVTLTMAAPVTFGPGDAIVVSGFTGTDAASVNGTFTALTASGTSVTYATATGKSPAFTGSPVLTLGSGAGSALPVRVLDVQASNSMVPSYDPTTGFVTWNRNGSVAVILI